MLLAAPAPVRAAIDGKVVNRTTGKPVATIPVTLLKFDNGMDPIEEVRTDANGGFAFQKPLIGSGGNAVPGMLRAEFEGVSYSQMIPPGTPTSGLEVAVFSVDDKKALTPRGHIMIFEPGAGEMVVNENFPFFNDSDPPKTFRDAEKGTLRFYLPPEAKGIVQVRTAGPQRMPLRSVAMPTKEKNVYMVDFPLKPGENSIDLTYLVPYQEGTPFQGRVLYDGVSTRLAAPAGVTLSGEGLVSMGQEPSTQASIYELPTSNDFSVAVSGQGRLARGGDGGGEAESAGGGGDVKVAPAPVAKEMYWVLGLTTAVLMIGFYYLYNAKPPEAVAAAEPASTSAPAASSGKPARQTPVKRKR